MSKLTDVIEVLDNCQKYFDSAGRIRKNVFKLYQHEEYKGTYNNLIEIADDIGCSINVLRESIDASRMNNNGWRVEKVDTSQYEPYHLTNQTEYVIMSNGKPFKRFNTIRETAEWLDVSENVVKGHLYSGKYKRIKGYTIKIEEVL